MGGLLRLHLACGRKRWEGFVNCDLYPGAADVLCDVRRLPFPDRCASEAHAIHVIEHFPRRKVSEVLREWYRVLCDGGKLVLEFPCLDKIKQLLMLDQRDAWWLQHTLLGLYGDQSERPEMMHHWCYEVREMAGLLARAGFREIKYGPPKYHMPARDVRMEALR